ncbi:MAG: HAD family hydrolase [Candidatus Cloacimonetes bacterium]|nr:HAD family hydrolase [Candidatus Cloacimonadota bacterium]
MAQVLTWDIDYTPADRPWSVVAVRNRRQLYEYLYPRSIVLLSEARFRSEYRWLCLLRLALPQARLAVVDGDAGVPAFFDRPAAGELDTYVADSVACVHRLTDTRTLFPRVHNALFPPQRFELIIFDMDGTLLKSDDYSLEAYQDALRHLYDTHGINAPIPGREAIIPRLGIPGGNLYRDLLCEDARALENEYRQLVRAQFNEALEGGRGRLFDGVSETLDVLRSDGRKLALVSHCPTSYFGAAVKAMKLVPWFDALLCIGERPGKGKADLVAEVMNTLGARHAVMVGDRKLDIDAGRANGCCTVGADWGFALAGELDDADFILDRISELPEVIQTMEQTEKI